MLVPAAFGQGAYYGAGFLPAINLNKGLPGGWKFNLKWESRYGQMDLNPPEGTPNRPSFLLADFAFVLSHRVGLNNAVAGGYLIRFEKGERIHRSIQQFTLVRRYSSFRMAHRFTADQTFSPIESTSFRFRYRLTAELPLNGSALDHKELYLKLNHEHLHGFQDGIYELEFRIIPLLGFVFSDNNKLEFGLDYRIDSFIGGTAPVNDLWASLSWYLKLP